MKRACIVIPLLFLAPTLGCADCGTTCAIDSEEDLVAVAQSGTQCELLSIEQTSLTSLNGAEGIRSAFATNISNNAALTDVSALTDFASPLLSIIDNPVLQTIAPGKLSASSITIDRNAATTIKLELRGDLELFIREAALETVQIIGDSTGLRLAFANALPTNPQWDSAALNMTTLRFFEIAGLQNAAQLEGLQEPSSLVGLYGCGLEAGSAEVQTYDAVLRARGFVGRLEVCPHRCDANPSPTCDDPERAEADYRTGCVVLEE